MALQASHPNVHVLEVDITDTPALEVFFTFFLGIYDVNSAITTIQAAAGAIGNLTGGTLNYLINNAAYVQDERQDYTLDG